MCVAVTIGTGNDVGLDLVKPMYVRKQAVDDSRRDDDINSNMHIHNIIFMTTN